MHLREAIKLRIKKLAKEHNINEYTLATLAGIAPSTLNDFSRGRVVLPKIDTILHICEALNLELKDFFDDPIFKGVEFDRK